MADDFAKFLASDRTRDREFARNGPELEISAARRRALEGAEILVVTSAQNGWVWPAEIRPYLVGSRLERPNLIVFGDLRLQATAQNPLVGLEPMSRGLNAVVGHAQFAMETVPAPGRRLPAILHTSGSVSGKRYSESKAGARGHFRHSIGALVV